MEPNRIEPHDPSDRTPDNVGDLPALPKLIWVYIPRVIGRFNKTLGIALQDGSYLLSWPFLASILPVLAICMGIACSWYWGHAHVLYTWSLGILSAMLIVGTISSALGTWLMVGIIAADFTCFSPFFNFANGIPPWDQFILAGTPLFICHVILFFLVSRTCLVSLSLSALSMQKLPRFITAQIVAKSGLEVLIHSALVMMWTLAAPSLIRPVFTWRGRVPSTAEISALQNTGWVLALVAGIAMALRSSLKNQSKFVLNENDKFQIISNQEGASYENPTKFKLVSRALLSAGPKTIMLSGILATWFDALGFLCFLLGFGFSQNYLAIRLTWWSALLKQIPVFLRVICASIGSYFISLKLIDWMWSMTNTFRPVLLSIAVSYVIYYICLIDLFESTVTTNPAKMGGGA